MLAYSHVARWGDSPGVRIPFDILRAAHIALGDHVTLSVSGNAVVMRRAPDDPVLARVRRVTPPSLYARADQAAERSEPYVEVEQFFETLDPERPEELSFGYRRFLPRRLPRGGALLIDRLKDALSEYCVRHDNGGITISPAHVVLAPDKGLVLRPTLAIVLPGRLERINAEGRTWGAPNIVAELLWPETARRIRCSKLHWYLTYGVQECWMIDIRQQRVEIFDFLRTKQHVPVIFSGPSFIESRILPGFALRAADLLAPTAPLKQMRIPSRDSSQD